MYQTAISAASASLRIAHKNVEFRKKAKFAMTKAFSTVGEIEFAKLAGQGDESLVSFGEEQMAPEEILGALLKGAHEIEEGNFKLKENLPNDFIESNSIKHQYVDGKGRGLVACRDILPHKLLMIDRAISFNLKNEIFLLNFSEKEADWDEDSKLCSILLNLAKHDGLLVQKLLLLENRRLAIDQSSDEQLLPLIENLQGYILFLFYNM